MWLQYTPWRVSCSRCGVKVDRVPWADGSSVFTAAFEESAAYLAQVTDRTPVSRLLGISWVAVGNIVERVVARRLDGARFDALKRIGVAEFSYRKRHHYLTIVVDHDRRRVVWGGLGRRAPRGVVGVINLDTCDAVEHRIFSVDLDEEEEDGCGRCAKPRSLAVLHSACGRAVCVHGSAGVHGPRRWPRPRCVRVVQGADSTEG